MLYSYFSFSLYALHWHEGISYTSRASIVIYMQMPPKCMFSLISLRSIILCFKVSSNSTCPTPNSWSASPYLVISHPFNWVGHKARTFSLLYLSYPIISSCAIMYFLLSLISLILFRISVSIWLINVYLSH